MALQALSPDMVYMVNTR